MFSLKFLFLVMYSFFLSYIQSFSLYMSNTAPGFDALGFGSSLHDKNGFDINTKIIYGTNALEYGANLLEENGINKVLTICGWNSARISPLMWELEPRQFSIEIMQISNEPTMEDVLETVRMAREMNAEAIIGMGGGSVMDLCKVAVSIMRHEDGRGNDNNNDIKNKNEIRLITIPIGPGLGAEISSFATLTSSDHSINSNDEITSSSSNKFKFSFKKYMDTCTPDLCLVTPLLPESSDTLQRSCFRSIGMVGMLTDLLVNIGSVYGDNIGFIEESMAWEALRLLSSKGGVLDQLNNICEERIHQWSSIEGRKVLLQRSNYDYESYIDSNGDSISNSEEDHSHISQYMRRYGHGLSEVEMASLSRAGISTATAMSGRKHPSPLLFLADTASLTHAFNSVNHLYDDIYDDNAREYVSSFSNIGENEDKQEHEEKHVYSSASSTRLSLMLPTYVEELLAWTDEDITSSTSRISSMTAEKAVVKDRLVRVAAVLAEAECLSPDSDVPNGQSESQLESHLVLQVADRLRSFMQKVIATPIGNTALTSTSIDAALGDPLKHLDIATFNSDETKEIEQIEEDPYLYTLRLALKDSCGACAATTLSVHSLQRILKSVRHYQGITAIPGTSVCDPTLLTSLKIEDSSSSSRSSRSSSSRSSRSSSSSSSSSGSDDAGGNRYARSEEFT